MAKDKKDKLTAKQQRFVNFYEGNATEAAEFAGYKHPRKQGSRLLTKVDILNAIVDREKKRTSGKIADRQERQEFWTKAMRDDKLDMKDRNKSSELLAKSEADFIKKVEWEDKTKLRPKTEEERELLQKMGHFLVKKLVMDDES